MIDSPRALRQPSLDKVLESALRAGILFCLLLCGSFTSSLADNFICPPNDKIVSTGDNIYTVQSLCGSPVFKNQRTIYGGTHGSLNSMVVEEWTYDLGPNRLKATLVFHNGVLFQIVSHQ